MNITKILKTCAHILIIFCSFSLPTKAQQNRGNDTQYYIFFPGSVTGRLYLSQKYTSFYLISDDAKDLHYMPNTTLNVGVGATYHNFSLNLAYGFGFMNTDDNKGNTKYLDLQGHFYTPTTAIDFYGQFYKGYHLTPEGFSAPAGDDYYFRPDAKVHLVGLSYYHILNSKRFSYRASLIQNEWQKKSAGTLLFGGEAYYGTMKDDSAWVPAKIESGYPQQGINKINLFSIGPGAGFAYTLVAFQHLFVTGSITGNVNLNIVTEHRDDDKGNRTSLEPVARYRLAAGYNGSVWQVSANWIADYHPFRGDGDSKYALQTGNYRFIIARRFETGPKLKRHLKPVNAIFKEQHIYFARQAIFLL